MAFLTEQSLRGFRSSLTVRLFEGRFDNIVTEARAADLTIFLSHSHDDRPLVEGFIALLDGLGIKLYVDWNDNDMPRVTSRETADKIKGQIQGNKLFMILATQAALTSKWVPWEIGVADKSKGENQVLIIPVADSEASFKGSEYLRLYRRVIISDEGLSAVFEPGKTKGQVLESYMQVFGR